MVLNVHRNLKAAARDGLMEVKLVNMVTNVHRNHQAY